MKKKEKVAYIIEALKELYPQVHCELSYKNPHELLIATRLSAQCTDKRVNIVTPALFGRYTSVEEFANADVGDVEELVKSCGLYKTKARDIVLMCRALADDYGSRIPDNLNELTKLPGVGRKTANLIIGELYGKPAIVTDTHVIRLSNRLGLADTKDAHKVEAQLRKLVEPKESMGFCHRLVWHGRRVCSARNPGCNECSISQYCKFMSKSSK